MANDPKITEEEAIVRLNNVRDNVDNYDSKTLQYTYRDLRQVAEQHPKLADHAFNLMERALASENNDVTTAFLFLQALDIMLDGKAVEEHPELVDKAYPLFKKTMNENNEYFENLKGEYCYTMGKFVRKKPELADDAVDVFEKTFNWNYYLTEDKLKEAYNFLDVCAEGCAEKPKLAERIGDIILTGYSVKSRNDAALHKENMFVCLCKVCRNQQAKEKLEAKYPDYKEVLDVAVAMGNDSDEDRKFAYTHVLSDPKTAKKAAEFYRRFYENGNGNTMSVPTRIARARQSTK